MEGLTLFIWLALTFSAGTFFGMLMLSIIAIASGEGHRTEDR